MSIPLKEGRPKFRNSTQTDHLRELEKRIISAILIWIIRVLMSFHSLSPKKLFISLLGLRQPEVEARARGLGRRQQALAAVNREGVSTRPSEGWVLSLEGCLGGKFWQQKRKALLLLWCLSPLKGWELKWRGGKASGSHSFLSVFIPPQGSPPRLHSLFWSGKGPPQGSTSIQQGWNKPLHRAAIGQRQNTFGGGGALMPPKGKMTKHSPSNVILPQ